MRTLPAPTVSSLEALQAENEQLRADLATVQEKLRQEQLRSGAYARVATERMAVYCGLLPPTATAAPAEPRPIEDRRRRIAASGLTVAPAGVA